MVKAIVQKFTVIWELRGGKSFLIMHAHYKAREGVVNNNCILNLLLFVTSMCNLKDFRI